MDIPTEYSSLNTCWKEVQFCLVFWIGLPAPQEYILFSFAYYMFYIFPLAMFTMLLHHCGVCVQVGCNLFVWAFVLVLCEGAETQLNLRQNNWKPYSRDTQEAEAPWSAARLLSAPMLIWLFGQEVLWHWFWVILIIFVPTNVLPLGCQRKECDFRTRYCCLCLIFSLSINMSYF